MRWLHRLKAWLRMRDQYGLAASDRAWIDRNIQKRAQEDHGRQWQFTPRAYPRQFTCKTCKQKIQPDELVFYWETARQPDNVSHWECANPSRDVPRALLQR